jgi:hypothetical protein
MVQELLGIRLLRLWHKHLVSSELMRSMSFELVKDPKFHG